MEITEAIQHLGAAILGGGGSYALTVMKNVATIEKRFKEIVEQIESIKKDVVLNTAVDSWKSSIVTGIRLELEGYKHEKSDAALQKRPNSACPTGVTRNRWMDLVASARDGKRFRMKDR